MTIRLKDEKMLNIFYTMMFKNLSSSFCYFDAGLGHGVRIQNYPTA